jgi:uncharacterized protein YhjY with autotransporter beta-barrel domain
MKHVPAGRAFADRARPLPGIAVLAASLSAAYSIPAQAQTLDQQYEYYLAGKCQNMGFARDASSAVLPGQAGPNLFAFCTGPPLTAGPTESSSSGGGAGAGAGRGEGAEEDAALRRRREKMRHDGNDEPTADATDVDLGSFGATSAFASFDYLRERQKTTVYEAGRVSDSLDGTFGIDHRFALAGLAGLAFKYHHQRGDIDSGGVFDVNGGGVWAYGSWWPRERLFVDFAAGIDLYRLGTQRIVSRQTTILLPAGHSTFYDPGPRLASSNTHSHLRSAELATGYDFSFASLSVGPRGALTFKHTALDAFAETGNTPMTLAFNGQSDTSLRSLLGMQASKAFTPRGFVVLPQLNVDWVHEYQDDQRFISARFAEDLRPDPSILRFLNQAPDRDWFVVRASTSAVFPHGVSTFMALETMAGHTYIDRYRASVGVRAEL